MPTQPDSASRTLPPVDHRPPAVTWRVEGLPKGYPAAFGTAAGSVMVRFDPASI